MALTSFRVEEEVLASHRSRGVILIHNPACPLDILLSLRHTDVVTRDKQHLIMCHMHEEEVQLTSAVHMGAGIRLHKYGCVLVLIYVSLH